MSDCCIAISPFIFVEWGQKYGFIGNNGFAGKAITCLCPVVPANAGLQAK
jgi:hypothetical protein